MTLYKWSQTASSDATADSTINWEQAPSNVNDSARAMMERQRLHRDDIDAEVLKTVATILTSFGIENEDRQELRADFQHLRRWRKSVEQAQSFTFKAVITIIVTGLVGAVWLGVKVMLGK
jgi:hypothetical protein